MRVRFCDWGSATYQKVKKFGDARIIEEFQWFGEHKIELLYNCDANAGQFERDVDLIDKLTKVKRLYGYPKKFRASYAKNSGDRVYRISKLLNDEGMGKGATLSFQSMDENTLEVIKRKNIGIKVFSDLMKKYRQENIPTYSELIVGLPGETYESFAQGINKLIESGQHNSIHCYCLTALPNSEMSDPEYVKRYGIKTVCAPSILFHCTPSEDPHQEYDTIVVNTSTLNTTDWLRCQTLSMVVQAFHCLGLTQSIAVFLNKYKGLSYRKFYETILTATVSSRLSDILAGAVSYASNQLFNILEGKESSIVDQRFGNIRWPVEEGTFLKLVVEKEKFYEELKNLLISLLEDDNSLVEDLIAYQKAVLIDPHREAGWHKLELNHNIHEYIQAAYLGESVELETGTFEYEAEVPEAFKDLEEYARIVVMYGRKGRASYQYQVRRIS